MKYWKFGWYAENKQHIKSFEDVLDEWLISQSHDWDDFESWTKTKTTCQKKKVIWLKTWLNWAH